MQAAVSDKDEEINIYSRPSGSLGFSMFNTEGSDVYKKVSAYSIDSVMDIFNAESIDILKIDVEGAEKKIFSGPGLWINKTEVIIAEMHDRIEMGCSRAFFNATSDFPVTYPLRENYVVMREDRYNK